jgi:hypothetical protein
MQNFPGFPSVDIGSVLKDRSVPKWYFFGWLVYRDIFQGTPTHVMEFCRVKERSVREGNPPQPHLDWEFCERHNCADEQCADYKEIINLDALKEPRRPVTKP